MLMKYRQKLSNKFYSFIWSESQASITNTLQQNLKLRGHCRRRGRKFVRARGLRQDNCCKKISSICDREAEPRKSPQCGLKHNIKHDYTSCGWKNSHNVQKKGYSPLLEAEIWESVFPRDETPGKSVNPKRSSLNTYQQYEMISAGCVYRLLCTYTHRIIIQE